MPDRRLAAILAADVVGYAAMTSADQDGTLAALRQFRAEILGPTIAGRRGKLVKSMGDGWLVKFGSAVDAVTCAMQVQDRLAGHATINLRIGIHIGDVEHEDEDVFGDGVNIAARLETLAEPGAVVISEPVYTMLDGTLRPSFDDRGRQKLKNIPDALRVFVRGGDIAGGQRAKPHRTGFPHLTMMPVATSDARVEVRELADALTGDLEIRLSAPQWLRADAAGTPRPESYVLRATLRTQTDRLRLETSLAAPDGSPIWSAKYDGHVADGFDWQDTTVEDLTMHVFGQIIRAETGVLERLEPSVLTAEQWLLKAILGYQATEASVLETLDWVERAIDAAPDLGDAYAVALSRLASAKGQGYNQVTDTYGDRWDAWLEQAEGLVPATSPSRVIIACSRLVQTGDPRGVRDEITEMLRYSPFDPWVLGWGGWMLIMADELDAGMACLRKAEPISRHTPTGPAIQAGLSFGLVQAGNDSDAVAVAEASVRVSPNSTHAWRSLAAALGHLGRLDEAAEALGNLERLVPGETIARHRARNPLPMTPGRQRYYDGLRLAGMPEGS